MEILTASVVTEYQQRRKVPFINALQFKALGRELRDRFGLTDREALDLLADRNVLKILASKEIK